MENLRSFIKTFLKENFEDDYQGQHSAPFKTDDDSFGSINDLVNMYGGEDIYNSNAYKYFGNRDPLSHKAINIIQMVRNKPNALIKIYRAIPNFNSEIEKKIKNNVSLLFYYNKFGFFPMKNPIIYALEEKYKDLEYDQQQKTIYQDLNSQISSLETQKIKNPQINNGDWVTTIRDYAVDHGKDHLKNNYKIISKTVKAKNIYNSGDSVLEYGYSI